MPCAVRETEVCLEQAEQIPRGGKGVQWLGELGGKWLGEWKGWNCHLFLPSNQKMQQMDRITGPSDTVAM